MGYNKDDDKKKDQVDRRGSDTIHPGWGDGRGRSRPDLGQRQKGNYRDDSWDAGQMAEALRLSKAAVPKSPFGQEASSSGTHWDGGVPVSKAAGQSPWGDAESQVRLENNTVLHFTTDAAGVPKLDVPPAKREMLSGKYNEGVGRDAPSVFVNLSQTDSAAVQNFTQQKYNKHAAAHAFRRARPDRSQSRGRQAPSASPARSTRSNATARSRSGSVQSRGGPRNRSQFHNRHGRRLKPTRECQGRGINFFGRYLAKLAEASPTAAGVIMFSKVPRNTWSAFSCEEVTESDIREIANWAEISRIQMFARPNPKTSTSRPARDGGVPAGKSLGRGEAFVRNEGSDEAEVVAFRTLEGHLFFTKNATKPPEVMNPEFNMIELTLDTAPAMVLGCNKPGSYHGDLGVSNIGHVTPKELARLMGREMSIEDARKWVQNYRNRSHSDDDTIRFEERDYIETFALDPFTVQHMTLKHRCTDFSLIPLLGLMATGMFRAFRHVVDSKEATRILLYPTEVNYHRGVKADEIAATWSSRRSAYTWVNDAMGDFFDWNRRLLSEDEQRMKSHGITRILEFKNALETPLEAIRRYGLGALPERNPYREEAMRIFPTMHADHPRYPVVGDAILPGRAGSTAELADIESRAKAHFADVLNYHRDIAKTDEEHIRHYQTPWAAYVTFDKGNAMPASKVVRARHLQDLTPAEAAANARKSEAMWKAFQPGGTAAARGSTSVPAPVLANQVLGGRCPPPPPAPRSESVAPATRTPWAADAGWGPKAATGDEDSQWPPAVRPPPPPMPPQIAEPSLPLAPSPSPSSSTSGSVNPFYPLGVPAANVSPFQVQPTPNQSYPFQQGSLVHGGVHGTPELGRDRTRSAAPSGRVRTWGPHGDDYIAPPGRQVQDQLLRDAHQNFRKRSPSADTEDEVVMPAYCDRITSEMTAEEFQEHAGNIFRVKELASRVNKRLIINTEAEQNQDVEMKSPPSTDVAPAKSKPAGPRPFVPGEIVDLEKKKGTTLPEAKKLKTSGDGGVAAGGDEAGEGASSKSSKDKSLGTPAVTGDGCYGNLQAVPTAPEGETEAASRIVAELQGRYVGEVGDDSVLPIPPPQEEIDRAAPNSAAKHGRSRAAQERRKGRDPRDYLQTAELYKLRVYKTIYVIGELWENKVKQCSDHAHNQVPFALVEECVSLEKSYRFYQDEGNLVSARIIDLQAQVEAHIHATSSCYREDEEVPSDNEPKDNIEPTARVTAAEQKLKLGVSNSPDTSLQFAVSQIASIGGGTVAADSVDILPIAPEAIRGTVLLSDQSIVRVNQIVPPDTAQALRGTPAVAQGSPDGDSAAGDRDTLTPLPTPSAPSLTDSMQVDSGAPPARRTDSPMPSRGSSRGPVASHRGPGAGNITGILTLGASLAKQAKGDDHGGDATVDGGVYGCGVLDNLTCTLVPGYPSYVVIIAFVVGIILGLLAGLFICHRIQKKQENEDETKASVTMLRAVSLFGEENERNHRTVHQKLHVVVQSVFQIYEQIMGTGAVAPGGSHPAVPRPPPPQVDPVLWPGAMGMPVLPTASEHGCQPEFECIMTVGGSRLHFYRDCRTIIATDATRWRGVKCCLICQQRYRETLGIQT